MSAEHAAEHAAAAAAAQAEPETSEYESDSDYDFEKEPIVLDFNKAKAMLKGLRRDTSGVLVDSSGRYTVIFGIEDARVCLRHILGQNAKLSEWSLTTYNRRSRETQEVAERAKKAGLIVFSAAAESPKAARTIQLWDNIIEGFYGDSVIIGYAPRS